MYAGYLIEIGNYRIRPQDIKLDSYSVTWNSQDFTAYRDSDGELHRNALRRRPPKVEFSTRNMMTNEEFSEFMLSIRSQYSASDNGFVEKRMHATIYIPEIDDYITDDVYMADVKPSIYRIDGNVIYYNSTRIAFIGYGKEGSYV